MTKTIDDFKSHQEKMAFIEGQISGAAPLWQKLNEYHEKRIEELTSRKAHIKNWIDSLAYMSLILWIAVVITAILTAIILGAA